MGNLIKKIKVYKNNDWISKQIGTKAENVAYEGNINVKNKISTLESSLSSLKSGLINSTIQNQEPIVINNNGVLTDSGVTIDKVSNITNRGLTNVSIDNLGNRLILTKIDNFNNSSTQAVAIDASVLPEVSTSEKGVMPALEGSQNKYFRADGTWAIPPDTNNSGNNKLPLSGGTMTGNITRGSVNGVSYIQGSAGNSALHVNKEEGAVWFPMISTRTAGGGGWAIGNYNNENLQFSYASKANINSNTNNTTIANLPVRAGTLCFTDQAISNVTRSGTTFTATRANGTTFSFTQQDNNTTYAQATTASAGLMPKLGGGTTNYLRADGSWATPPNTNTTYPNAISAISRSGTTFTATRYNGTKFTFTQQDNNTTYGNATTAANGLMTAAMMKRIQYYLAYGYYRKWNYNNNYFYRIGDLVFYKIWIGVGGSSNWGTFRAGQNYGFINVPSGFRPTNESGQLRMHGDLLIDGTIYGTLNFSWGGSYFVALITPSSDFGTLNRSDVTSRVYVAATGCYLCREAVSGTETAFVYKTA